MTDGGACALAKMVLYGRGKLELMTVCVCVGGFELTERSFGTLMEQNEPINAETP